MTPAFLLPLRVEYLDGDTWRLTEPLVYDSALVGRLIVPPGFVTDLESVPRWLPIAYTLVHGYAAPAAVVHDALYQRQGLTRATADAVFLEAMDALGVSAWRRYPIYAAVRAFGWAAWSDGPARLVALGNDVDGGQYA